jgi:RimJ/RimL family protein N-acetyltransferase
MLLPVLETDRLTLRPFRDDDAEALHRVVGNDPDMTWDGTYRSLEYVIRTVQQRMQHFVEHGFGVWAVIERETGEMIGQTGLQYLEGTTDVELVVYTARRRWRHGFAEEGSLGSLRYGFEVLQTPRILAVVRQDNAPAQRLVRKLGFAFVENTIHYETDVQVSQVAAGDFLFPQGASWALRFEERNGT